MVNEHENLLSLVFLPTWRLVIVLMMYCAVAIQLGAMVIFGIEQKPMHPIGELVLSTGSILFAVLGYFIGKKDLAEIRRRRARLEVTRWQIPILIFCLAMVPGSLLILIIVSGI